MSDEDLAMHVIGLGVGEFSRLREQTVGTRYYIARRDYPDAFLLADEFVRDWRVAGALMEKVHENTNRRIVTISPSTESRYQSTVTAYFGSNDLPRHGSSGDSLARTVIESCVAALVSDRP